MKQFIEDNKFYLAYNSLGESGDHLISVSDLEAFMDGKVVVDVELLNKGFSIRISPYNEKKVWLHVSKGDRKSAAVIVIKSINEAIAKMIATQEGE